jgi:aminoglycoside phosphotransferase (APT) family kinase protein
VSLDAARAALGHFRLPGAVSAIEPFPAGHINDSFLVACAPAAGRGRRFLLQRLNRIVFPRPRPVMENVARVTAHLADKLQTGGATDPERRALSLVATDGPAPWYLDERGDCWRAYRFIEGAGARERIATPDEARAAGRAFGAFLAALSDLPGAALHETIPGFHDTAGRYAALDAAAAADRVGRAAAVRDELAVLQSHRHLAGVLPPLVASGRIPIRTVHNDAKVSNLLVDGGTGEPVCVVDLDTVMPGSALHELGDLVRSAASEAAEDEPDAGTVRVRPEIVEALQRGYVEGTGALLTPDEQALFHFAGQLITLEQAVRFLTDYLDGDRYYRTTRSGQNLDRARVQIRVLEGLLGLG